MNKFSEVEEMISTREKIEIYKKITTLFF